MLHTDNETVKKYILDGNFGLERENLRVTEDGRLSHSADLFQDDPCVMRDFCENQVEINTGVYSSIEEAIDGLKVHSANVQKTLSELEKREYLWPFSNPPYILNEADIPIAQFYGDSSEKTDYRNYLADRYGRYKMTFSGIHFNFSFSEKLLQADFLQSEESDFETYKEKLYMTLAERLSAYGWILNAITAASPLMDKSFVEKGCFGNEFFCGMGSVRCSELGYWNFFAPVFNYKSATDYVEGIQNYVDKEWIKYPSELYYPVRLKPKGDNMLENFNKNGISNIELRMFDLNPLCDELIDARDLHFAHLLIIWLMSDNYPSQSENNQVQTVQNFKNAARYDLKTVNIMFSNGKVLSVVDAALALINNMKEFYSDYPEWIMEILEYQENKFIMPDERYAWKIRNQYRDNFVQKGIELAKQLQQKEIDNKC